MNQRTSVIAGGTVVAVVLAATGGSFLAATAHQTPPLASLTPAPVAPAVQAPAVARVAALTGTVAVARGDAPGAVSAAPNAPLLGGDTLTTARGGRADVAFDAETDVRLDSDAQARFARIADDDRTVQLAQGTIEVRIGDRNASTEEVDTPSVAVLLREPGAYRLTVDGQGRTFVTVRSGEAEVRSPQSSQTVDAGTTLVAQGDAADPSIRIVSAVSDPGFDAYSDQADATDEAPPQTAYVDPSIAGVGQLDADGRWVDDTGYGEVWIPASVGPDWAPYRDGRWVWEDGYGWTWVSNEPWGWAPYHYGNWYHSDRYGWAWCPPRPHAVAAWRPAIVAFIGLGGGSNLAPNLNLGGGDGIGWVPLAPGEPYHPWWGERYGRPTIVNNTTIVNTITTVNTINVYRNVRYGGVSYVSGRAFATSAVMRAQPAPRRFIDRARVFTGPLPVVPGTANLRFRPDSPAPVVRPLVAQTHFAGSAPVAPRTDFREQRVAYARANHVVTPPDERGTALRPAAVGAGALAAGVAAARAFHTSAVQAGTGLHVIPPGAQRRFGAAQPAAPVPAGGERAATFRAAASTAAARPAVNASRPVTALHAAVAAVHPATVPVHPVTAYRAPRANALEPQRRLTPVAAPIRPAVRAAEDRAPLHRTPAVAAPVLPPAVQRRLQAAVPAVPIIDGDRVVTPARAARFSDALPAASAPRSMRAGRPARMSTAPTVTTPLGQVVAPRRATMLGPTPVSMPAARVPAYAAPAPRPAAERAPAAHPAAVERAAAERAPGAEAAAPHDAHVPAHERVR